MDEIKYIRYLRLNQLEHLRSRKIKLGLMRMRNETNKIGVNINQIVKNSNSHIYREDDKMELESQVNKAASE